MSGAGARCGVVEEDEEGRLVSCTEAEEARAWTEVFTLFQQSGRDDRGAAYAMSMGALRRKGEDLDQQIEALSYVEDKLLHLARQEARAARPVTFPDGAASGSSTARVWGRALAGAVAERARDTALRAAAGQKPWQAAVIADDAHMEAVHTLERQQREQAEAEARAKADEAARAQAEAQAAEVRAQEARQAEKAALRAQGLNSRRLPLRPGLPPCGFFMRKGVCKHGKICIWDHPEPDANSKGYPLRPGQAVCALYRRTHTCKFGVLCAYDHPEGQGPEPQDQPGMLPLALAKASAQQHQLQLLLHLQLQQEMSAMQDPEAMMNAWVRFRITFSLSA